MGFCTGLLLGASYVASQQQNSDKQTVELLLKIMSEMKSVK